MAKNSIDMESVKNAKKDIKENVKQINATLLDLSEDIIKETVKTGEAWQKLMSKAIKNSEPLMKKQSDILFETVKGMKTEAEYSVKRFEKLTGLDFSDFRNTLDTKVPAASKWIKEGFEYITDQTEEILTEVSKRGDEIVETITDTAKAFTKEAEGFKDTAEAKVIEVIKDVEDRITDVAPQAGAAVKKVTSILIDDAPLVKKPATKKKATKAKKTVAKKAAPKAKATKKTATKKATTARTVAPKATKPVAAKKKVAPKNIVAKSTKADNLKVIEGVGPKLEQLLIKSGITSYAMLAKADVADLQKVLDAAGSRYKMHNPNSWPLQARFARDGKFDALKSWQKKYDAKKA